MQERLEKGKNPNINQKPRLPEVLAEGKPHLAEEMQKQLNWELLETAKGWNETSLIPLLEKGADPNAKNRRGITALMYAAWFNHPKSCALLIRRGANVNATDIHGNTPLIYAARVGSAKTCMLLIEHDANINAMDETGKTALMHADESIETAPAYFETAEFLSLMGHLHGFMVKDLGSFMASFRKCIAA